MAFGVGRCGSKQVHSASERSVRYALLMLDRIPSQYLRTPFRTVSPRASLNRQARTYDPWLYLCSTVAEGISAQTSTGSTSPLLSTSKDGTKPGRGRLAAHKAARGPV